jgi:hypothetical protein
METEANWALKAVGPCGTGSRCIGIRNRLLDQAFGRASHGIEVGHLPYAFAFSVFGENLLGDRLSVHVLRKGCSGPMVTVVHIAN